MTFRFPTPSEFAPKQGRRKARLDKRQTEPDKAPANPFDTSPQTEREAVIQIAAEAGLEGMVAALQKKREWITLQTLTLMKDAHVDLEGELPEIDGERLGLFLFTVSGSVAGKKYERCLVGGDAILISAANEAEARQTAQMGLLETIKHAETFAFAQEMGMDPPGANENPGISLDATLRPKR